MYPYKKVQEGRSPVYASLISRNRWAAFSSSWFKSGWYCMESLNQASLKVSKSATVKQGDEINKHLQSPWYWYCGTWSLSLCIQGVFPVCHNNFHNLSALSPFLCSWPEATLSSTVDTYFKTESSDFRYPSKRHIISRTSAQCAVRKVYFSAQPNKLRHILKVASW